MLLARVVGHVVATAKHPAYHGFKLLLVEPVSASGASAGPTLMAVDSVGAGAGERVLVVVEGRSAGAAVQREQAPVDAAIVGIVDRIDPSS
ncbi:MAG TPA: EutN/CcmL family microcompartment protein [Candidatus Polarisedimenticolia bacterium]|nr:EutN/CcmL family microcompartment protein [Candidatus Polarisedimenticolia bacterium]